LRLLYFSKHFISSSQRFPIASYRTFLNRGKERFQIPSFSPIFYGAYKFVSCEKRSQEMATFSSLDFLFIRPRSRSISAQAAKADCYSFTCAKDGYCDTTRSGTHIPSSSKEKTRVPRFERLIKRRTRAAGEYRLAMHNHDARADLINSSERAN